ncbi:MAG: hypothetical protein Ta2E_08260 [Mycoplasmoidaceae bacterium]|nr:MAG: hypothetical protein Ta2E_08260 [Mycoplasmoidaceae bacterium]
MFETKLRPDLEDIKKKNQGHIMKWEGNRLFKVYENGIVEEVEITKKGVKKVNA